MLSGFLDRRLCGALALALLILPCFLNPGGAAEESAVTPGIAEWRCPFTTRAILSLAAAALVFALEPRLMPGIILRMRVTMPALPTAAGLLLFLAGRQWLNCVGLLFAKKDLRGIRSRVHGSKIQLLFEGFLHSPRTGV